MVSKNFRQRKTILGFLLALVIALLVWQFIPYRPGGRVQEGDYLIYKIGGALFMYTPYTNEHRPILEEWSIESFTLKKEWLAFSSNNNIYLLNYPFTDTPQPITAEGFGTAYIDRWIEGWSTDGRYLAYKTSLQDTGTHWLWDNTQQKATPFYHYSEKDGWGWVSSWGYQGQFAFTYTYHLNSDKPTNDSEVFIWDGQNILNLSQNPDGDNISPVWNQDGRLAFLSASQGEIFVWDGVSKKDGLPDKSSFINVAPHLTYYASYPDWNHLGMLTFHSTASEIYQWDGSTVINLSNNPDYYNHGQSWNKDGYWAFGAFVPYSYEDSLIHVRNPVNETVFSAEGYSPAWSEYGLLAFCTSNQPRRTLGIANLGVFLARLWGVHTLYQTYFRASTPIPSPSWRLSVWTGDKTAVKIVEGDVIEAIWSNGQSTYCSSG